MAVNLSNLVTNLFSTLNSSNNIIDSPNSSTANPASINDFAGYLLDYTNSSGDILDNLMGSGIELLSPQSNTSNQRNQPEIGLLNDSVDEGFTNQLLEIDSTANSLNDYNGSDTINPIASLTNYLQTSFQIQHIESLSSAIAKLQSTLGEYEKSVATANSELAQQRVESMTNNITQLDTYLTSKVSELTTEESLLSSLNASSTLTKYLITRE